MMVDMQMSSNVPLRILGKIGKDFSQVLRKKVFTFCEFVDRVQKINQKHCLAGVCKQ